MSSNTQYSRGNNTPRMVLKSLIIILLLLLIVIFLSVALGSRSSSAQEIIDGLFHPTVSTYGANVVRKRISRTVFGLMCGSALGLSGTLMQSVTRNHIADPSILGVNTGAALSVVTGIAFFGITTANQYIGFAFVGAMSTAIFVYGIGSMGKGGATPIKLVLAGAATSAALSSLVTAIMIPRSYVIDLYRFWQVGSVGSGDWDSVVTLTPYLIIGVILAFTCTSALNAMELGDEAAKGLGVRVGLVRLFASFAAVILCAAVTALAGPIAFIGLLAPHLVRLLIGADLKYVLPLSVLIGAIVLLAADVVGRLLTYPGELEVGVVTAFIGAPILIYSVMRSKT